ncbi:SPRY domain-containing SOCS box protein 3-like isoform X1 [Polistes fuscatus]|uniref:SPRY domain-containing SOCS box protein 3-like isoform X1 n=1 Tax=Polistes fuscatus TaxID=30207 RepID=UPI001CA94514|nr:SPRY domain-containing SOCS box protein 3-like isoform X1 [Polistes fuscatus]
MEMNLNVDLIESITSHRYNVHEWAWDEKCISKTSELSKDNLEVKFHPKLSIGTAYVRGNVSMQKGRHHYWEIKMMTVTYGTDVMIGVGTSKIDLTGIKDTFCSLLGRDKESWGFSYKGYIQHAGERRIYTKRFCRGDLVGVHFDGWKGTLQYFLNRKPLGIAFTGLQNTTLYPMVCSTAANSKVIITHCSSVPASLQMECLSLLQPVQRLYLSYAFPGLRYLLTSIFFKILHKRYGDRNDDDDDDDDNDNSSSDELIEFMPKFRCLSQLVRI